MAKESMCILFLSISISFFSLNVSGFYEFVRLNNSVTLERSRSFALLFSSLQCISNTDENESIIKEIYTNFDPNVHINEYKNPEEVKLLLKYVEDISGDSPQKNDDPFTNSPQHISQLSLILNTLYFNTENWPLFFNTSAWLIDRVNSNQLFWSLKIVSAEKFPFSVITPTTVEVFPQLYINKKEVAKVAGMEFPEVSGEYHPLQYFTGDPGINEFHTHWHMDNPFWWNATKYGVKRDRKGELFFYMHHQIVTRYQAELLSNGLQDVAPLELDPDYVFPEGYYPDIVNANYEPFPIRKKGERMKDWDDGKSLAQLKTWYERLTSGISQGYFLKTNEAHVSLRQENGTDILGSSVEASTIESVNTGYYGSFHNFLHRFLGAMAKPRGPDPGVEAHSETAMRDPVFYRLHKLVDGLYLKLKSYTVPYTKNDLDFPAVQIRSVSIESKHDDDNVQERQIFPSPSLPTLVTYFVNKKYDISTAARPCRGVGEQPAVSEVTTLDHFPFDYIISVKNTKSEVAHGMMRIFLLPEFDKDGKRLDIEDMHQRAIELDRFRLQLDPYKEIVITRSSLNSSVTRGTAPGVKSVFQLASTSSTGELFQPKMARACGFPQNLLIPKGAKDGLRFKLTVMISEEHEQGEREIEYPNYPYCGSLNGYKYPDMRSMGFPFDRPGTRFISYEGVWAILGGYAYKNVKQIPIIIKHQ